MHVTSIILTFIGLVGIINQAILLQKDQKEDIGFLL
ncbi:hypothetical protein Q655_00122 [Bartonella henselae JK 51]|uniref:Uncharacterized protein n=1 Tax=Bartonella henselae TaxID=38323 RepID=X5M6P1_BARHN|nr:hypothetical protein Q654_00171 [Bartonella henselae JK 50]ETS10403.1 hypothetical protein Q655_00122 [Bartonella henselae JK 51]CDO46548.1 hypothetical protein BM1374165_00528 [Bartonella henselae]